MRHGARVLVMAFAPMIGRPGSARRVRIAYNAYSLEEALAYVDRDHRLRGAVWIQRRDETAHLHRRRSAKERE